MFKHFIILSTNKWTVLKTFFNVSCQDQLFYSNNDRQRVNCQIQCWIQAKPDFLTFPGPILTAKASPTSCSLLYAAAQSMCLYPQSKAASTACFTWEHMDTHTHTVQTHWKMYRNVVGLIKQSLCEDLQSYLSWSALPCAESDHRQPLPCWESHEGAHVSTLRTWRRKDSDREVCEVFTCRLLMEVDQVTMTQVLMLCYWFTLTSEFINSYTTAGLCVHILDMCSSHHICRWNSIYKAANRLLSSPSELKSMFQWKYKPSVNPAWLPEIADTGIWD